MRPIDGDALLQLYENGGDLNLDSYKVPVPVVRQNIIDAPTLDYEPVRHGEWIEYVSEDPDYKTKEIEYKCSECGIFALNKYPYCHCGAKMDAKEDENA